MKPVEPITMNTADKKAPASQRWVVVLANNRAGSAGSNAAALARSVPGCLVIGCNTSSGFTFADVVTYGLKYTAIRPRLPRKIIIHPDFDNQKGFLPGDWLDSAGPVDEVVRRMTAPDNCQFRYHR